MKQDARSQGAPEQRQTVSASSDGKRTAREERIDDADVAFGHGVVPGRHAVLDRAAGAADRERTLLALAVVVLDEAILVDLQMSDHLDRSLAHLFERDVAHLVAVTENPV